MVDKPVFSFGVLADTQYADVPAAGIRYYRASLEKLDECVREFNTKELAFVAQLGDLIERKSWSFDAPLARLNRLEAPIYHVLGNHDFAYSGEAKHVTYNKLGLDNGYYDFSYKPWRFIVLDGNDISFQANGKNDKDYTIDSAIDPEKFKEAQAMYQRLADNKRPNATDWNGGIGRKQIDWLKSLLEQASKSGEKAVIFCHYPIRPALGHCNLWNDDELLAVVEGYDCVKAWISGHNHSGGYELKSGIHHVTIEGMVETSNTNAFGVVEVYDDHLNIKGYGRLKSCVLKTGNERSF